jgi:hypothetical protein
MLSKCWGKDDGKYIFDRTETDYTLMAFLFIVGSILFPLLLPASIGSLLPPTEKEERVTGRLEGWPIRLCKAVREDWG